MAVTLTYDPDTITLTVVMAATSVQVAVAEARDAYQIAVAEGFVGTRAEWLASLQGPASTVPGPPGVGKTWIKKTLAQWLALPLEERTSESIVYNIIPEPPAP